ncbi:hypothetical protein BH23PLA1_BH23PLA1_29580 [soil metagenome]
MMNTPGDFSDHAAGREMNYWFGGQQPPSAPGTLYVGLSIASSFHNLGYLWEVNLFHPSAGYARVAIANIPASWTAEDPRIRKNSAEIVFPVPTADWGKVRSWFLADAATDGNVIASGDLPEIVEIGNGQVAPRFAVGALVFSK